MKTISHHRAAIANYDEWIKEDPDNPELLLQRAWHEAEIERIRTVVRERDRRRRAKPVNMNIQRQVESLNRKIAKKEAFIEYCNKMLLTNLPYYRRQISDAEFEIRVMRTRIKELNNG